MTTFYLAICFFISFCTTAQSHENNSHSLFLPQTEPTQDSLKEIHFSSENTDLALGCRKIGSYTDLIRYLFLFGSWTSDIRVNSFVNNQGFVAFTNRMNPVAEIAKNAWNFSVTLYDGEYVDENSIKIDFSITDPIKDLIANYAEATFMGKDFDLSVNTFKPFGGHIQTCQSDFTLQFIDTSTGKPLLTPNNQSAQSAAIQLNLTSPACFLEFTTSLMKSGYPATLAQALVFAGVALFYCLFGYVIMNKVIVKIEQNPSKAPHVSHWSLMFISIWNVYLLIFHLLFAAQFSIWFVATSFLLLFLRIFREMYLTYILFARDADRTGSTVAEIKSCCKFFGIYYLLVSVVLFLVLSFPTEWRNLISSFFLLPQILMTAVRNKKYRFSYWYEFGMTFCQCLWIVYANLLPGNILRSSPKVIVVIVYMNICLLQIALLGIQTKYPRFFWTAKAYRYTFVPANLNESLDICPICIEPLLKEKDEGRQSLMGRLSNETKLFQTPCKHRFHDKCLKRWMQRKFECPFCKQRIPSISLEVSEPYGI